MITREKLAEWQALCEKATPGPWTTGYHEIKQYCGQNISTFEVGAEKDMCWIAKVQEHHSCINTAEGNVNGEFIAASRTALPEAIAEIAKLRAILERSVEWWLREGKEKFDGAPEWVFAAREVTR